MDIHHINPYVPEDYNFFVKEQEFNMSYRRLENNKSIADFISWGRRNPVEFIERVMGITLMDYQRYIFMESWNKPFVVWCMSRNGGKSILLGAFLMTKSLLVPNYKSYILSNVGSQAIQTFSKIEQLAKKEIPSFDDLNDIFYSEVIKSGSHDGFKHDPKSYNFKLFNGSEVKTLNGAYDNNRSHRANCVVFDEAGFAVDELFVTAEPFTTQDSDFITGETIDTSLIPKQFPNQLIYASSASSTDTYFWKKYKDFSKRMLAGDKDYFVADISSDVIVNATRNNIVLVPPLLSPEKIDAAMRDNKEKALREYKNIFTTEGGDGQIIKRASIIKNSVTRPPILTNDTGDRQFCFAYDPARSYDNSVVTVGEFYEDEKVGLKMRIANVINFMDLSKKLKTPMRTPEQVNELKNQLINYNAGADRFDNITGLLIDAGSGGAGVNIADYLMEDWERDGINYPGFIDKEYSADYCSKFPNAIDKLQLISPSKFKSELFESLIEAINLDLIEFTSDYIGNGFITIDISDDNPNGKMYKLSPDEEVALSQIDALKEECVNMYRYKSPTGKDRFDLSSDKAGKLNDDRVYTLALLAWKLMQLRRKKITGKKKEKVNIMDIANFKAPNIYGNSNRRKVVR